MKKACLSLLLAGLIFNPVIPAHAKTRVSGFMPHSSEVGACGKNAKAIIAEEVEFTFNSKKDPEHYFLATVIFGAGLECTNNTTDTHGASLLIAVTDTADDTGKGYYYSIVHFRVAADGNFSPPTLVYWRPLPGGLDDPRLAQEWCAFVKKEHPAEWNKWKEEGCGELR